MQRGKARRRPTTSFDSICDYYQVLTWVKLLISDLEKFGLLAEAASTLSTASSLKISPPTKISGLQSVFECAFDFEKTGSFIRRISSTRPRQEVKKYLSSYVVKSNWLTFTCSQLLFFLSVKVIVTSDNNYTIWKVWIEWQLEILKKGIQC